jgi:NAD(P)-dependent dehydrogenase (short-subunit alcohol dehydrogenase family)
VIFDENKDGKPRRALVTGANRGIGRAIAENLAHRNDTEVLVASRDQSKAERTADEIGRGSQPIVLDLTRLDALEEAVHDIEKRFGQVDILVNNAGILIPGSALEVPLEAVEESLSVNALAPFVLTQSFGREMKERGWGRIVNVSSGWGSFDEGLSGPAAYAISKATLNALTVSFAQAFGRDVKINPACPGRVRTEMGGQLAPRSPFQGADTSTWLATLPGDGPTGGFFRDRHLIEW